MARFMHASGDIHVRREAGPEGEELSFGHVVWEDRYRFRTKDGGRGGTPLHQCILLVRTGPVSLLSP